MMDTTIKRTSIQEIKRRYEKLKEQGIIEKEFFECSKCEDKGYTFNKDNEVVWCECKLKKDAQERLEKSGLADRVSSNTFKNYKTDDEQREKAVVTCLDFIKNFKENQPSLILMGEVGAGKTHLAIATCNKLLSKYAVKYVLYEEIRELKYSLTDRENYNNQITRLKNVQVLFIDDLFKNLDRVTDPARIKTELEVVYEIINYRYNKKKPVIITTELNINQLMKIDKAIASRVLEMAKGYWVIFDGVELNYRIFGA